MHCSILKTINFQSCKLLIIFLEVAAYTLQWSKQSKWNQSLPDAYLRKN